MPATRSRTEHWKDSLTQIIARNGSIEIAVRQTAAPAAPSNAHAASRDSQAADATQSPAPPALAPALASPDLVWRTRLLACDNTIVIEQPTAAGKPVPIDPGTEVVGIISVGQNRWMFTTKAIAQNLRLGSSSRTVTLEMPSKVERCTRRDHARVTTATLNLPTVVCWPVLDLTSVQGAEVAYCERYDKALSKPASGAPTDLASPIPMPIVGPAFTATLLNISGGGLGLLVPPASSMAVEKNPYFWLHLDLRPGLEVPVLVTARRAHSHRESSQHIYCGMAFDFGHHSSQQRFVTELLCGYVQRLTAQASGKAAA